MAEASAPHPAGLAPWTVRAVGCTALATLRASRGVVRRLPGSSFWAAGDDVVWLARREPLSHPRAFTLAAPWPGPWDEGVLALEQAIVWRPALPRAAEASLAELGSTAESLAAALPALEAPRGLGLFLGGGTPDFPLGNARAHMARVAQAACGGDMDGVAAAIAGLIGLGAGLTPSGDDFLAGIAFATRLGEAAYAGARPHGQAIRDAIRAAASLRTNRVSAALLRDATQGFGFRAMHELSAALAARRDEDAVQAARRLSAIGHSSGWDLLVGLLAGLAGARIVL